MAKLCCDALRARHGLRSKDPMGCRSHPLLIKAVFKVVKTELKLKTDVLLLQGINTMQFGKLV